MTVKELIELLQQQDPLLKRGLVHLTKEAAIAHAKAMLSLTEIKE